MRRPRIRSYHEAESWLRGARDPYKNHRSLYEQGSKAHLVRTAPDVITVIRYGAPVVAYFKNGDYMLFGSRYMWQGARMALMRYAPVEVVTRNHRLILRTDADGVTPPKIQKCRACHGIGKRDLSCYGVRSCEDDTCERNIERKRLVEEENIAWWNPKVYSLHHSASEHGARCQHGMDTHHNIPLGQSCWKCQGRGKFDYGNKPTGRVWSGLPVKIDSNGNYLEWNQSVHGT
jgi:hypothetical protein